MNKKILGQYFTTESSWLKKQVKEFIENSNCKIAYDPFAGDGDLIKNSDRYGINEIIGLDIDKSLNWLPNDSLESIPFVENAIIITNPPYLTKYSAKRKKINAGIDHYFNNHTDLYQLAIDKMLEFHSYVVAIVPETYINSSFFKKNIDKLYSVTILTESPFKDTENPVCVVCFDSVKKDTSKIKVYIDEKYIISYKELMDKKIKPKNSCKITFNSRNGNVGIRAVDMQSIDKKIKFLKKEELKYDLLKIKTSSRLITLVNVEIDELKIEKLINLCNLELEKYRNETKDILLSPFKGNAKDGLRRRRLDYATARAMIEKSYEEIILEESKNER